MLSTGQEAVLAAIVDERDREVLRTLMLRAKEKGDEIAPTAPLTDLTDQSV